MVLLPLFAISKPILAYLTLGYANYHQRSKDYVVEQIKKMCFFLTNKSREKSWKRLENISNQRVSSVAQNKSAR